MSTLHFHDTVGNMTIQTAYVPTRGLFLTMVLKNQMPWDLMLAATETQARENHDAMFDAAAMWADAVERAGGDEVKAAKNEMEKLRAAAAVPVKGTLLN